MRQGTNSSLWLGSKIGGEGEEEQVRAENNEFGLGYADCN